MSSKDDMDDAPRSPGVFQRMLKLVSGSKGGEDPATVEQTVPNDKTKIQIQKQRNDMVRRKEFEELRHLHRQQALGEDTNGKSSSFLGTEQSKASSRQAETLNKINQLESQMATLWSKQQENATIVNSRSGVSTLQGSELPVGGVPSGGDASSEEVVQTNVRPAGVPVVDAGSSSQLSDSDQLSELTDPALEEAGVLFASNEDAQVEKNLQAMLTKQSALRNKRVTWLTLMDFYRATGNQAAFEPVAMEYMALFAESAPQWQVFDPAQVLKKQADISGGALVYWQSPVVFDLASAQEMDAKFNDQDAKVVRVMDWNALKDFQDDTAPLMLGILAKLDRPQVTLQMTGGANVLAVLAQKTRLKGSQGDPVLWQLRLELMRLFGGAEEFDMEAMEYCLAHEVSPPSWVLPLCKAEDLDLTPDEDNEGVDHNSTAGNSTLLGALSGYYDPHLRAPLRLRGALKTSLAKELKVLDNNIVGEASFLRVNCERLVRIDFAAAGDLLNWVSERAEKKQVVQLLKVNRLVAAFFIVMGISASAQVSIRRD